MKRSLLIASGIIVASTGAFAQVINFHDASQNFQFYGGYNVLYYGQGAYSDPGNNVWNGFGQYGNPGTTDFYGPGNTDSGHGSVPNGNPGNPYAWHSGTSSTGANLYSPTSPGAGNVGNATSAGTISPVQLSLSYTGDNGSINGVSQGQPNFILGTAAIVNGGATGTAKITGLTGSTVSLYLYGANYDNTRGAAFTITLGGGTAVGGLSSTIDAANGSPANVFIDGVTYVEFTGVVPVGGEVDFTWGAVSNPTSGLSGEGDFNGLQIVESPVPEPSTMVLLGLGGVGMLALRRRKK